jgi:hypothetical protein
MKWSAGAWNGEHRLPNVILCQVSRGQHRARAWPRLLQSQRNLSHSGLVPREDWRIRCCIHNTGGTQRRRRDHAATLAGTKRRGRIRDDLQHHRDARPVRPNYWSENQECCAPRSQRTVSTGEANHSAGSGTDRDSFRPSPLCSWPDRFEVATLQLAATPASETAEAEMTQRLTVLADEIVASLQSCTDSMPVRSPR